MNYEQKQFNKTGVIKKNPKNITLLGKVTPIYGKQIYKKWKI